MSMSKRIPIFIHKSECRQFIRHPLFIPIKYQALENNRLKDNKLIKSTTINISRGGLMFASPTPAKTGTTIIIHLPLQNKLFKVKAKVVHCNKSTDTGLYNIGVCFFRFSDAFKIKLIEQMYLIIEYRDLRSLELGTEITLQEASAEWIKRYSERFKRLYW